MKTEKRIPAPSSLRQKNKVFVRQAGGNPVRMTRPLFVALMSGPRVALSATRSLPSS